MFGKNKAANAEEPNARDLARWYFTDMLISAFAEGYNGVAFRYGTVATAFKEDGHNLRIIDLNSIDRETVYGKIAVFYNCEGQEVSHPTLPSGAEATCQFKLGFPTPIKFLYVPVGDAWLAIFSQEKIISDSDRTHLELCDRALGEYIALLDTIAGTNVGHNANKEGIVAARKRFNELKAKLLRA